MTFPADHDPPLIAIVLPDMAGGGAERVHLELAREFVALSYRVEFVLLRKEGQLLADLPAQVTVVGLDVAHFRSALAPLRRYLKTRRPRIVMAAMWPLTAVAIVAARTVRPSPRVLVGEHIDFLSGSREHRWSMLVMRRLGRLLYSHADAVLCVSAGARHALARITGFPEKQIAVVFNPVRAPVRIEPLSPTADVIWWQAACHPIVTAGRLTEQKDHATLIRAIAALPPSLDARLLILGEGPERARLEGLIASLGLADRVRLAGFVGDVPAYLARASLLAMSSRWEGLPVILIEALLQGVPIVATDCPSGPAEILDGGRFGRLVALQDPEALASAIVAALADSHAAEGLATRGALFDPARVAREYLRLADPGFSADARPTTR